ncbi:MAG: hypothetical protein RLZZ399_2359 [Verrucomicrobiota bacterium]|jgi:lysophospholipase L1-like esterase
MQTGLRKPLAFLFGFSLVASLPLPAANTVANPTPQAASTLAASILQSKRIVFLGDSITAGAGYVIGVAGALRSQRLPNGGPEVISAGLSSETTSGLSEPDHGGVGDKGFPRPYVHERLTRVLDLLRPNVVFACYGINCGIYQPFDESRFEAFRSGMQRLHEVVEKSGATIVHITPPFFDSSRKKTQEYYPEVMRRYSDWLVSKRSEGWHVIDLHTAMKNEVLRRRETEPNFTMAPDGVHPSEEGHWLMARQVLGWLGDKEASQSPSLQALMEARHVAPQVGTLVRQRVQLTRDSYVHAAGHKRPGVAKGLPLEEAQARATEIDRQIDALLAAP